VSGWSITMLGMAALYLVVLGAELVQERYWSAGSSVLWIGVLLYFALWGGL
jgi:hypothetical protein